MKKLKPQRIIGTPIIFMEGGIVQDVFLPKPANKKQPFTNIDYDIVDMDVLKEGSDEEIENHWKALEPETREYFVNHQPDTYARFRRALEVREREHERMELRFTATRLKRAIEGIRWGEWVLRRHLDEDAIEKIRLFTALDELTRTLSLKLFPTQTDIVKMLAGGAVVSTDEFEYVLDAEEVPI